MKKVAEWNHKWFGIWRESGPKYGSCPSVYDFVNRDSSITVDRDKIRKYIENGRVVATTSRMNFPCVITGEIFQGALSCRTDGEWLWWDDLVHYIEKHNLCLPDEMASSIIKNGYVLPAVTDHQIRNLEWPSL